MRAAPLLLVPFIVLVGCGKGGSADMAVTRSTSESLGAAAPMADGKAASGLAAFRSGRNGAVGGVAAAQVQARTAAYQVPVAVPRMVVRNGNLNLRVKDIKIAEAQVRNVARGASGSVDASEGTDLAGPSPSLSMTLRVPEGRFDATMASLEGLGERLGKTISSEDVTSQAVDMDARVRSLRVQEEAYRAILAAARRISDVLEVQQKLTEVRTEIEQIVAQRRTLGDQAARSTIVVSLAQTAPVVVPSKTPDAPGWFASTWGDATGSLLSVVRALASLALWLTVMSPVWLPLGAVAWIVWRRTRPAPAA